MVKRYLKYIVTFIIGLLMAYGVFSHKDIFKASNASDIALILSDGFLLPAVTIGGLGILFLVSKGGMFDIFIYGAGVFIETFKPQGRRNPDFPKTYFDYKEQRERYDDVIYLLVVGGIFLLLSIAFNIIFNVV